MADINEPMQVMRCRVCDALLKAEHIDFNRGIATCGYCKAIMRFDTEDQAPSVTRAEIALPGQFTVEDLGDELRISWRWFTYKVLFLAVFCIFWCGFLVVWYIVGMAIGAPLLMLIFPIIHVAVGIGLTYVVLCYFLNTTRITVARGRLTISHGPCPWPGGGSYDTDDLTQFFCEHKEHRGENGTTHRYHVGVINNQGRRIKLLGGIMGGLDEPHKALFIEQQLEKYLGIRDEAVMGEYPR